MATARTTKIIAAAVALVGLLVVASPSEGQVIDDLTTTTTTTAPPAPTAPNQTTTTTRPSGDGTATTTTTAPSSSGSPTSQPAPAPPSDGGDGGDGGVLDGGSRTVPPEAQAIIDAVDRTPANSSKELFDAVQTLVDLGLSQEEAIRVGFGRFPVAGVTRFGDDWLYPRWGPGFRFHHGTDLMAPYGTPLRAPVDGTVTTDTSALGGLSTKIFTEDGTYFYYAHLSALVDGFENGMTVETGDIVGYVGDSGNARGGAPHLHLGIYPQGGAPTNPKPLLDQFLDDAMARLPAIIEDLRESTASRNARSAPERPRTPRSLLATALLRDLADERVAGGVSTELLYQATTNPTGGGLAVVQAEAHALAADVDWDRRAQRPSADQLVLAEVRRLVDLLGGPTA